MVALSRVHIEGFTSMRYTDVELKPINVCIGANGSGKSNLVSFFQMLSFMMTGAFQEFVGRRGYAHSLLHYGPGKTETLQFQLDFPVPTGVCSYAARLAHAAGDTLIFAEEKTGHTRSGGACQWEILGSGHKESLLPTLESPSTTARTALWRMSRLREYHVHDTSQEAAIRGKGYIGDNRYLRADAGNLAACLLRLKNEQLQVYERIVRTIRQVAPFFKDFELTPASDNDKYVSLDWRDRHQDYVFGPSQLSDGSLRAMALLTALLRPKDELPQLMILDEPELGLHPYAISILADLMHQVSHDCQILVSTQSTALLDHFDAADVIVADRQGGESQFRRLDEAALDGWIEEYALSELWEKNVLGGRPSL